MFDNSALVMMIETIVFIYLFSALICIGVYSFFSEQIIEQYRELREEYEDKSDEDLDKTIKSSLSLFFFFSPLIVCIIVVKEISYMIVEIIKSFKKA